MPSEVAPRMHWGMERAALADPQHLWLGGSLTLQCFFCFLGWRLGVDLGGVRVLRDEGHLAGPLAQLARRGGETRS